MSDSEAYEERLKEEARLKAIFEATKRLTKRKLDYPARKTYKRENSYKGRNREALIHIHDQEDFREEMSNLFPRPRSRQHERRG